VVHAVKGLLSEAKIPLSHDFQVEISHHYGLDRFTEVGCVIIDCFNREYAKKLIIQLPGQWHPVHYHRLKDETFQVLHGTLEVEVEGKKKVFYPGDTLWVPRGVWHGFRTDTGVVFEEISTAAKDVLGDSYYVDKTIAARPRDARKTRLMNWGRHQFDDADGV
jgi:N-acetylneuraminate synthase